MKCHECGAEVDCFEDEVEEIGFTDFLAFASGFGKKAGEVGFDPTFDLDGDLQIAFSDFLTFVQNFGANFQVHKKVVDIIPTRI